MRIRMTPVGLVCALTVATACVAGEFTPGHVFVTLSDGGEGCAFGGQNWILEIDPATGDTSIFADSDDGLCNASGLRFTPDSAALRVLNSNNTVGVQEYGPAGNGEVIFDGSDGLVEPFGYNGLAFDAAGDFYVVNAGNSTIMRYPADGTPGVVFATPSDGVFGRGALDFAPNGDLFYCSVLAQEIVRITPDGVGFFFDQPPGEVPVTLAFDSLGNLFVGTNNNRNYAIYRYDEGDPASRILLATFKPDAHGAASAPVALTVSPDDSLIYFGVGLSDFTVPGGYLYGVDPVDGSSVILADFAIVAPPEIRTPVLGIAVSAPPAQAACEGDANADDTVDPLDSGFVLARFGCEVGVGDDDCNNADQNADGAVDPLDVGFVLARFGPCH